MFGWIADVYDPASMHVEATVTPDSGGSSWGPLLLRIQAHPGRWVSVYPARP